MTYPTDGAERTDPEQRIRALALRHGLRIEPLGKAVRIVGRGVYLVVESLRHVRRSDLRPVDPDFALD